MVHVNSFLGCAKIETGGKIVALLQLITYGIVLIILLAAICLSAFNGDQNETPLLNDNKIVAVPQPKLSVAAEIIIAIFIVAACIAIIVIAFRSFNAIKTRNHTLMFEMMALMFAVTCFYMYVFLIQFWLWPMTCIPTVFVIVYNFYLYLVVYSLYRVFRKEFETEAVRQHKASVETNV